MKQPDTAAEARLEPGSATTINRPGLSALRFRAGTHATLLARMKERLATVALPNAGSDAAGTGGPESEEPDARPLARLSTRASTDPAIALLDGWAVLGDILTFYNERIANEGYLRTATERRSLHELGRLVGYRLRPGVAATTYLAYTLDSNVQGFTELPAGAKVQSVPGPGELPQTFETSIPLKARAAWNALRPRLSRPQDIRTDTVDALETVYVRGTTANLKENDLLLFVFGEEVGQQRARRVLKVTADFEKNWTRVDLQTTAASFLSALACTLGDWLDQAEEVPSPDPGRDRENGPERLPAQLANAVAIRMSAFLTTLRTANDLEPGQRLRSAIGAVAPGSGQGTFQTEFEQAAGSGSPALRDWLSRLAVVVDRLVATLPVQTSRQLSDALRVVRADGSTETPDVTLNSAVVIGLSDWKGLNRADGATPPADFRAVLHHLRRPPARRVIPLAQQPANARAGLSSDGAATRRLLQALDPDLAEALPSALGNVAITPPTTVKVYAFRTKAAPFGHYAPLRQVTDQRGAVLGTSEWPLNGTDRITLEATVGTDSLTNLRLRVTDERGFEASAGDLSPGFELRGRRGHGEISGRAVRIKLGGQSLTIELPGGGRAESVEVSFDDISSVLQLPKGDQPKPDAPIEAVAVKNRRLLITNLKPAPGDSFQFELVVIAETLKPAPPNIVPLDSEYGAITAGGWIVLERPPRPGEPQPAIDPASGLEIIPRRIQQVTVESLARYGLAGKSTSVQMPNKAGETWLTGDDVLLSVFRQTTVHAQSESLDLSDEPITEPLGAYPGAAALIELDGFDDALEPGRTVIVTGERLIPGISGVIGTELATIRAVLHSGPTSPKASGSDAEPTSAGPAGTGLGTGAAISSDPARPGDRPHTFIGLAGTGLAFGYRRETVKIYANVVAATHGETRQEVLGGGDASKPLLSFALKQAPVTQVPAATPTGIRTTLEVCVDDVRWEEAESLSTLTPTDQRYITETGDEGQVRIIFGTGRYGARPRTGADNIRVTYRQGMGRSGNLKAGQLSLPMTRPLGVREATNPLPASGGTDPEGREEARRNIPSRLYALDRLVSVQDYADFTRAFAGVSKATAARLSDGHQEVVHVTVAGIGDARVEPESDLFQALSAALHRFGDPALGVRVSPHERKTLLLAAGIGVSADADWTGVEAEVRAAIREHFSFERRDLGQDVTPSEVIRVIQQVRGVVYVDLDLLLGVTAEEVEACFLGLGGNLVDLALLRKSPGTTPGGVGRNLLLTRVAADLDRPSTEGTRRILPAQLVCAEPTIRETVTLRRMNAP